MFICFGIIQSLQSPAASIRSRYTGNGCMLSRSKDKGPYLESEYFRLISGHAVSCSMRRRWYRKARTRYCPVDYSIVTYSSMMTSGSIFRVPMISQWAVVVSGRQKRDHVRNKAMGDQVEVRREVKLRPLQPHRMQIILCRVLRPFDSTIQSGRKYLTAYITLWLSAHLSRKTLQLDSNSLTYKTRQRRRSKILCHPQKVSPS